LLAKSFAAASDEVYGLLRNDNFPRWLLTDEGKMWSARLDHSRH
jgi:hypothetical protein